MATIEVEFFGEKYTIPFVCDLHNTAIQYYIKLIYSKKGITINDDFHHLYAYYTRYNVLCRELTYEVPDNFRRAVSAKISEIEIQYGCHLNPTKLHEICRALMK